MLNFSSSARSLARSGLLASLVLGASLALAACGDDDDDAGGGTAGSAGTDGGSGSAGSSGGAGGSAGSSGSSGQAGSAGSGDGGTSGGAGAAGSAQGSAVIEGPVNPSAFFAAGDKVFFNALRTADKMGETLWVTDGTTAGTREVAPSKILSATLRPTSDTGAFSNPDTVLDGKIVFSGYDVDKKTRVYVSDGTEAGTVPLSEVRMTDTVAVVGKQLYFVSSPVGGKPSLWVTDGTPAGTSKVLEDPNADSTQTIIKGTGMGGKLYFYLYGSTSRRQLWVTDGTAAGTSMLAQGSGAIFTSTMAALGERLFFSFDAFTSGPDGDSELWSTDGTAAGTKLVKNLNPDASSHPTDFQVVGSKLVFSAYGPGTKGAYRTTWVTDGTEAGTVEASTARRKEPEYTLPAIGNKLLFSAFPEPNKPAGKLYATDGSAAAPEALGDIMLLSSKQVAPLAGGKLVFFGYDGTSSASQQPWITDGTPSGTSLLATLDPAGSNPFKNGDPLMAALDGKVYFLASTATSPFDLFVTDGTTAGTKSVLPDDALSAGVPLAFKGALLMSITFDPASSSDPKVGSLYRLVP